MNSEPHSEKLPFRGFDERGELRVYQSGEMPHWRQAGCTYFVTFRLADSVPQTLADQWATERTGWLKRLGVDDGGKAESLAKISVADRRRLERHFGTLLNDCLDGGHGRYVLRDAELAQIVAGALYHFHPARVITGDSVVMPNHVHALMRPNDAAGFELEGVLQAIKSFTAKAINRKMATPGRAVWQRHSYDHIVRDREQLLAFQRYIRNNPERARLGEGSYVLTEAAYDLGRV